MLYFVTARTIAKTLLVLLAIILMPAVAEAQQVKDTKIRVTVCPSSADQSGFTIDKPVSDSVVDSVPVVVTGTVSNISQIDFLIDGVYGSSIQVSGSDSRYSHILTLTPGTHTIKLIALDSCQKYTHSRSVIITVAFATSPSKGPTTPTIVPGTGNPSTSMTPFEQKEVVQLPGQAVVPVPRSADDIAQGLDLDTSLDTVGDILRAMIVLLGLILVAAAPAALGRTLFPSIANRIQVLDQDEQRATRTESDHKHHHHMVVRLFGLILIILPFLV